MMQTAALRSRLEKQPTDLGRRTRDLGGGALGHAVEGLFMAMRRLRVRENIKYEDRRIPGI